MQEFQFIANLPDVVHYTLHVWTGEQWKQVGQFKRWDVQGIRDMLHSMGIGEHSKRYRILRYTETMTSTLVKLEEVR